MHYLTKRILLHFNKEYLKNLKTFKDVLHAYDTEFAPCMADNPSDLYPLMGLETRGRVVNELYDFLEIWRKLENE